ncbi:hypothetical protein B0H15DRAFT_954661 [Mycena belliarum]|uniref:Uncharacterized protein n=1 Tax=Mycena belliarum TaxID=1033014 RepID=A0AAD6TY30_9AGAR|nr:hypothetical protein B0H15DRAFT_954661 [Mycena belliae]
MHFAPFLLLAATAAVHAFPLRLARHASASASAVKVNCESADDDGSPLTASGVSSEGAGFASCTYQDAGECVYFAADGSFSSGSSTCPQGLPQDADFGKSSAENTTDDSTETTSTSSKATMTTTSTMKGKQTSTSTRMSPSKTTSTKKSSATEGHSH